MSLFDWFTRRSRLEREPDRVFLTRKAKWRALAETVVGMRSAGVCAVIVAHFPATLAEVAQRLAEHEVPTETQDDVLRPGELTRRLSRSRDQPFLLLPAPALALDDEETTPVEELPAVTVLVPEMHPLPEREADVAAFAEQLPSPTLVQFASLEDPVMKLFAGAWLNEMLKHLGMKEDEEIRSSMVSRQIRRAQQRIARQVETEVGAQSVEEWMEQNVPAGRLRDG
jgi:preprotein translocase subunit SecA